MEIEKIIKLNVVENGVILTCGYNGFKLINNVYSKGQPLVKADLVILLCGLITLVEEGIELCINT